MNGHRFSRESSAFCVKRRRTAFKCSGDMLLRFRVVREVDPYKCNSLRICLRKIKASPSGRGGTHMRDGEGEKTNNLTAREGKSLPVSVGGDVLDAPLHKAKKRKRFHTKDFGKNSSSFLHIPS